MNIHVQSLVGLKVLLSLVAALHCLTAAVERDKERILKGKRLRPIYCNEVGLMLTFTRWLTAK